MDVILYCTNACMDVKKSKKNWGGAHVESICRNAAKVQEKDGL